MLLAVAAAAALALRPAWLGDRLARWASRRGIAVAGPLRQRTLALMVAIDVAGWAATGAGAALLAHGLLGAAAPGAFVLLGAFALSWVAGVLLPLLPAGLGPRDALLALGLAGALGAGAAASLALALRVVSFAGELVAVGGRRDRRARARAPRACAAGAPCASAPRAGARPRPRSRGRARGRTRARSSSSRPTTSSSRCRCSSSASRRPASTC